MSVQLLSVTTLVLLTQLTAVVSGTPAPVSVNFGTTFLGSDGLWSPAQIRVGNPEQYLSVYPSTVNSDNWVVGTKGCDGTLACQTARGGLFNQNTSTSYSGLGTFELGANRLGLRTDYGYYGLDTMRLSDKVTAPAQILSTITDNQVWLGRLGLNVQDTQFSDKVNHLSLIASLVRNDSVIPSHSYGYTAGASYRGKGVPGSLVLGGVDTTRYTPNNAQFSLSTGYMPKTAVTAITVSSSQGQGGLALPPNWMNNPLTLMQPGQAAQYTIDSSTPFLWMPAAVCDTFAKALNLTYNDELQLYMFPNTTNSTSTPQTLRNWGITFTFSLSNSIDDSRTHVEIPISYSAFDLQLSYGFPGFKGNATDAGISYFPLRKANSTDQYTIGRAFLQETYLTVDYERNVFSLAPAVFPDVNVVLPNLVAIQRPAGSSWPGPSTGGLSTGAKAGTAVGIILVLAIAGVVAFFLIRRRRRSQQGSSQQYSKKWWRFGKGSKESEMLPSPVSELVADRRHPREMMVDSSRTRFELPGPPAIEMPAGDVPEQYYGTNHASHGADAGFANHPSMKKDYNVRTTVTERSTSPAPQYSPGGFGRLTNTNDVRTHPLESGLSRIHGSQTLPISPIGPYSPGGYSENSPISTEMRSSPATTLPQDGMSGRFREDLVDHQQQTLQMSEQQPGHRYSWEQHR